MASISPIHPNVPGCENDFRAVGLETRPPEEAPMLDTDDEVLAENQHYHEFSGERRVCDCGMSRHEYLRSSDKEICAAVLEALFDPLPLLQG